MRELIVDFNLENPLSGGCEAGNIGENNATKLIIKPSAELLDSGSEFFVAVFMSKGEIYRSEHFEPAESFEIMLGSHLTQDHYLKVQLEGYAEEDMLICKSPMVSEIRLMPSIAGCESEIKSEDYSLRTQIALNSKSRHSHENPEVLSLIGEKDGSLSYNGKNVCEHRKEKSIVLFVANGDVDAMVSSNGSSFLSIYTYSDIENFVIPSNAEIKSVELGIENRNLPEWVDMRDMLIYDSEFPYILQCHKTFVDNDTSYTTICRAFFFGLPNSIASHITDMCLKKVRITYIEPPAEVTADE